MPVPRAISAHRWRQHRRRALCVLALLPAVCAAQLTTVARQEIDALLRAVSVSGCDFLRAGSVHPAAEARKHLQRKFDHLDALGQLTTAEDFIAKAATRSSLTGEAYGIRCAGAAPQPGADWMLSKLKALRAAKSKQ